MKPGKQLIAEERAKVLKKISREDDIIANVVGQLESAARKLSNRQMSEHDMILKPQGWDSERWRMMYAKPYTERLVIAGQLYLAEADRCKAMALQMAKKLDLIRTLEVEK